MKGFFSLFKTGAKIRELEDRISAMEKASRETSFVGVDVSCGSCVVSCVGRHAGKDVVKVFRLGTEGFRGVVDMLERMRGDGMVYADVPPGFWGSKGRT